MERIYTQFNYRKKRYEVHWGKEFIVALIPPENVVLNYGPDGRPSTCRVARTAVDWVATFMNDKERGYIMMHAIPSLVREADKLENGNDNEMIL